MNASDVIRKVQARAIFSNKRQTLIAAQGSACTLSTCCGISTCVITYPSYEFKYLFNEGQVVCNASTCTSSYPLSNVGAICQNNYV